MPKFCGKCGSPLNADGSCPKCDAVQGAEKTNENIKGKTDDAAKKDIAPEKPAKLTHKEKQAAKKAEKKRRKKEKRATMSFGQKTKRFFLKLLAVIVALAIITGSVSCALVYFDVANIPFVEKFMGLFGYEKEEPEETNFASVSGKFTDEKITNADEAIRAAQNAASQLGLQKATDELSLLKEDTVGDLTYYRLQQNYQGIPVYGKTIVVVADKNGEAKDLTSNAVEYRTISNKINNLSDEVIKTALHEYFGEEVLSYSKTNESLLQWYKSEDSGALILAYKIIANFSSENYTVLISAEDATVLFANSNSYYDSVQSISRDKQGTKREITIEKENDNKYLLFDEARNIEIWTCNNGTLRFDSLKFSYQGTEYTVRIKNNLWVWDNNLRVPDDAEKKEIRYTPKFSTSEGNTVELISSKSTNMSNDDGVSAMYNAECTYDFYKSVLKREGYNGLNSKLYIYVDNHLNGDTTNANSWQMAKNWVSRLSFGSDTELKSDLVAHEYTHAVESSISNMMYQGLSGAIMEAYSDVFGELVEDWESDKSLNNSCDWVHGQYGRDISNPHNSEDPDKFFGRYFQKDLEPKYSDEDRNDYGGVHQNSTVISHAAYLMNSGIDGEETALSNDKIAKLWYQTLFLVPSNCSFLTLKRNMEITAEMLGFSQEEIQCITKSFEKVGISTDDVSETKYDTKSEVKVYDKSDLVYDDYTIVIDGKEFTGLKWGFMKKDYHKEISVNSADPYELNLPKGDYTITIVDNFSGNKTYSKSIKARDDQKLKKIEFATAFGFDYSVNDSPELQVKDINGSLYDNYIATIKGKTESGTSYNKTITVDKAEAPEFDLETGKYSLLLTDNADKSKTKSFTVRVRPDAPTNIIQIKTVFGKPYGEFNKSDLPSGAREFNGHYYYIYNLPEVTTWEQAQQYCRSKNGYLATLTTKEENAFAYSLLKSFNLTGAYFGLHDTGYNDWKWVNNEKFSYSNWAYGEPSSYSEPYGMFYEKYVETWNDGDFGNYTSKDRAFICEWGAYEINSEQVPETPTQRTTSGERDVVLCLDMSGSMAGDKLQQTKEASIKFINTVLQEDASIAIVTYDGSARVLSDFSVNANELISKINEISDGGSTDIEDGLVKSYNLLNYSNAKKQIIVLMSDGEPNSGKVGEELISYANSIKKEGVYIYTLGFFGGYSGQSAAQTLMEGIASEGCHYEVSDADSLVFFFGDIADTINGQEYIYIRIACPVDVKVSHNGETLNSNEEDLSTRTSFGSLTFEENTSEYSEDEVDDRVKILRLKADDDYDISIEGTGRGRMNYTIGFMDENGEYTDFRKFTNIKIRKSTVIDTVATKSRTTVLKVDEDGDGKYDLKYKAGANERGEIVDYSYIFYIVFAIIGVTALLIVFLIVKKKRTRKRGF